MKQFSGSWAEKGIWVRGYIIYLMFPKSQGYTLTH